MSSIDVHGSDFLDIQEAELAALGIGHGGRRVQRFVIRSEAGTELLTTLTGYYSQLEEGAWKAVPTPEGTLKVAMQTYEFSNPARAARVQVGSLVHIRPAPRRKLLSSIVAPHRHELPPGSGASPLVQEREASISYVGASSSARMRRTPSTSASPLAYR